MARQLQHLGKCQIYEAIEMTETCIRLIDSGSGNTASAEQLNLVSIAGLKYVSGFNIGINKTWHTNCRNPDVSKILDWLVI